VAPRTADNDDGDAPVGSTAEAILRSEGLRERKKRQMRELISNTATEMFLARGFDDVRVTEVAERCGVSEKTVYNYFPTKESLVLDREEDMVLAIRTALGPGAPAHSPTQAALELLKLDLEDLGADWPEGSDAGFTFPRFAQMIEETPSLRAAQRDMMDRLVQVGAEALADRAGVSPDDPEPQIAATAIVGLWRIQYQALRVYATPGRSFDQISQEVMSEVARAARLIDSGLWAFEVMVQGRGTREQLKAAAEAAQSAGRQVAAALRQARDVWRQVQDELHGPEGYPANVAAGHHGHHAWHQQGPRSEFDRQLAEWKAAQRELKQQYFQAKRDQQSRLRETIRRKKEEGRQRRRQP
jgi:AcrR family transcriptional regulator